MKYKMEKSIKTNALRVSLPLVAALAVATPNIAQAEGYALQNWSARGAALAGGLVARGGDASVAAYNPAAMTELEGTQIMLGGEFILPQITMEFAKSGRENAKSYNFFVPNAYLTHKVNDKLAVGLATYSRFGLGSEYESEWAGRYSTYHATILTSTVSPVVAYKVTDKLSLGAGFEISGITVDMKQKAPNPFAALGYADVDVDVTGDLAFGYAFNLSAHYRFNDQWAAGLVYRMGPRYDIEGDFTTIAPTPLGTLTTVVDASATLDTPDQINLAVAYAPTEKLSFEAGFAYVMWSEYQNLDITHGNTTTYNPKDWDDTYFFSLSAEYDALDWLTLRAGVSYETSPMNHKHAEYILPTDGRINYSVGAGFHKDDWTLDLGYTYHDINTLDYNESTATGVDQASRAINTDAHAFSFNLSYKF